MSKIFKEITNGRGERVLENPAVQVLGTLCPGITHCRDIGGSRVSAGPLSCSPVYAGSFPGILSGGA